MSAIEQAAEAAVTRPRPAVVPEKASREDTTYVVLALTPEAIADDIGAIAHPEFWTVEDESVEARSAAAAVKAVADEVADWSVYPDGLTLVAVPSRSWKPVKVKPQTVTTLVIEDA